MKKVKDFKIKLQICIFLLTLLIIPLNAFAYSKFIIPGGQTIGIEVNSKGVLVVGFYKVNDNYLGKDAGFEIGDRILAVNNKEIATIDEMVHVVNEEAKNNANNALDVTIDRNGKSSTLSLNLVCDNDQVCKTGLYVKDEITGIGTLTYIDPNTTVFGALGHEILEKTTSEKFEIKDGKIFRANVVGTTRSNNGSPGEKNATYDKSTIFGNIYSNEKSGIFGTYNATFPTTDKLEVASKDEVKTGKAIIRTVVSNDTIEEYEINILKIDKDSDVKNILFEITDSKLLEKTGGVVQGMSGSPIIQNNKIIGAVTHVIVSDTKKGYGIFITTMLEEGEKKSS